MRLLLFALALCFLAIQTYASPVNKVASKEANEQIQFGDIVDLNKEPEITTTSPAPSSTTPANQSSEFVPFSEWHCGSNDFDKWLAHELIQEDCPSRMVSTNDCCLQHDTCYTEQLSQEECDQVFCQCLDNALKPHGCGHIATSYCRVVEVFGAEAHKKSKDYVAPETKTSTTTSTTTPAPSTTEISQFKAVDKMEKRLFKANVNQTWNPTCYGDGKGESACKANLDLCTDGGFTCVYEFCECAHQEVFSSSVNKDRAECKQNLETLCGDHFANEEDHHRHHPTDLDNNSWSEESLGLSAPLAIFILGCLLISAGSAVFWVWRYIMQQRRSKCELHGFSNSANASDSSSSSLSSPSNSSSAASFLLTSEEDAESGKLSTSTINCMHLLKA